MLQREAADIKALALMRVHVISTHSAATLAEVMDIFDVYQVSILPVVDHEDTLLGLLLESELSSKVCSLGSSPNFTAEAQALRLTLASQLMRTPAPCVDEQASITDIVATLNAERLDRVPVVSGNKVVGTVGRVDVAQALFERDPAPGV